MNPTQLLIQTGITFIAASLGTFLTSLLGRRTEKFKHLQELRSSAYANFLTGFAKVTRVQNDLMREEDSLREVFEGTVIVTHARAQIAIYGGSEVVASLANFVRCGTQTETLEGRKAFAELCATMREEVGRPAQFEDVETILFRPR
jgi:hypothetical protein